MTNLQVFIRESQNEEKLCQTNRTGSSEHVSSSNNIQAFIDLTKENECASICNKCLLFEQRIQELKAELQLLKLDSQKNKQSTSPSKRSIRVSPFRVTTKNVNSNIKENEETKHNNLRYSYQINEHELEQEIKKLRDIEEMAEKLSTVEKKERDILKQIIKKSSSLQGTPRSHPTGSPKSNKLHFVQQTNNKTNEQKNQKNGSCPLSALKNQKSTDAVKNVDCKQTDKIERQQSNNRSQRDLKIIQQFGKNDNVPPGENLTKINLQLTKTNVIEPELQADIKSVSSLYKSSISMMTEKDADTAYKSKMRNQALMAKIKNKKK